MTFRDRVERAKETAKLGGVLIGVALTVGVLGALWAALHEAEDETLFALLAEIETEA